MAVSLSEDLRKPKLYLLDSFATDGHFREALEPSAGRNLRAGFQPGREEFELKDGNLSLLHAQL